MGLLGIVIALSLLMWFAFRGWSVLFIAPLASLLAAFMSSEPLLASWTQIFMPGASGFIVQWFPMFLLGGLFGKLMDDSGSIRSLARFLTTKLGKERTLFSVVLASAIVTYGGVSVFVAFFVLVPMARDMFQVANIPKRLMPATIGLGAFTFTMSAMPGTPSVNNAIPMPFFGTTTFAAPGLGLIASAITLVFGMWWLNRVQAIARRNNEGYSTSLTEEQIANEASLSIDEKTREVATLVGDLDPQELLAGHHGEAMPPFIVALLPILIVISTNFLLALFILPAMDFDFLMEERWGNTHIGAVAGIWSVVISLGVATLSVILLNFKRLPKLRESLDAGANSSTLPILTIASLVGFGAVVANLDAFAMVRDAVLEIPGGPLVSLTVAMNVLAGLTGTASGGMAIALNALGDSFVRIATEQGIDLSLMHRLTTLSAGTLDALPHNGTVLLLLQISGLTHKDSYMDMVMTVIVGVILSLIVVLFLGSTFGSF